MARLFSFVLLAGSLLASTLAAQVKLVDPPKDVKLNDRKHPITVAYADVNGEADVHVDLIGDDFAWLGGGQARVQNGAGQVKVPIEVRVSPDYQGQLTMRTWLSRPGANYDAKLATTPDYTVGVSKVPTDAIGVICQPSQVAPGQGFTVSLWYTQTHARESDIIAVALHADTKEYFGGFTVPINQQQGQVSGHFQLKYGNPNLPLKFKAWISPRGEEAPNYVSYTMIMIPLGWNVQNDCYNQGTRQWTPNNLPPADWVELRYVPNTLGRGQVAPIGLAYNLASAKVADLEINLMTWNWQTHEANQITGTKAQVTSDKNELTVNVAVPANAQPGPDGIFVIVYFSAAGKGYEDALAEDRKYKVWLGDYTSQATPDEIKRRTGLRIAANGDVGQYNAGPRGAGDNGQGNNVVGEVANTLFRGWFGGN